LRIEPDGWSTLAWLPNPPGAWWYNLPPPPSRIDQADVPARMPQLNQPPPDEREFGRPTLARSDPERAKTIAVLVDLCGRSVYELTEMFEGDHSERSRSRARRRLTAGRRHLSKLGVLPWAAFVDGVVPPNWMNAAEVADWIQQWRWQAKLFPR
jgi:hypothetical protein